MGTGRFLPSEPNYWWTSMDPMFAKQYHDIPRAWAVPMIMGTEYLVHWGTTPMDWTSMTIRIETFDDPSLWVHVRFNFTDHREMFEVRRGTLPAGTNSSAVGFVDPTLLPSQAALTPTSPAGASSFDNTTAMEFRTVLTGQVWRFASQGSPLLWWALHMIMSLWRRLGECGATRIPGRLVRFRWTGKA